MSNESTRIQPTQSHSNPEGPVRPTRHAVARKALACGLLLMLGLFGTACDDDNNGGGSASRKSPVVKLVSEPVDLPAGQTEASMAWEPSIGAIDSYLIFLSRNGSVFNFTSSTPTPDISISGQGGDEVRIVVVAVNENGALSESSPPSAPVRFYAEETELPSVAAAQSRSESATASVVANASSANASGSTSSSALGDVVAEAPITAVETAAVVAKAPEASAQGPQAVTEAEELAQTEDAAETDYSDPDVRAALRERLLSADARLASPLLRSNAVDEWLQSFVDEEIAAGVMLIGTGNVNGDETRELIFKDAAGQLFVADGETFLGSTLGYTEANAGADTDADGSDADLLRPAETLVERLRLRSTERFLGLENFGDEVGSQWLIEDSVSGQISLAPFDALTTDAPLIPSDLANDEAFTLLGHGDFDGDGEMDLLWRNGAEDQLFASTAETDWIPNASTGISIPDVRHTDSILAIADFNGDGQDDVLTHDDKGRLRIAIFLLGSSEKAFWVAGTEDLPKGLDLVGTLDIDRDGVTEIAWRGEAGIRIWDARQGPETIPTF
ncbi:MAG: FG-GAP-like repeat-containing protein [Myxococcota bacterium]